MLTYDPSESAKLPEGHYRFQVREEPEKRRNDNGNVYFIFKFKVMTDEGTIRKYNDIFVPWEDRFKTLLLAFGAKPDEDGKVHVSEADVVGKVFEADIVHVRHPKDPTKIMDKIANIQMDDEMPMPESPESEDDIPF